MSQGETHPTDMAPVIRWNKGAPAVLEMRWGLAADTGEPIINIPTETAELSRNHRCLIPASDFELLTGAEHPKRHSRITLKGEPIFFAGVWRQATPGLPDTFAALTIDAAPDLLPITDRQMAVIRASDTAEWLGGEKPAAELLQPLPAGSYVVERDD